MKRVGDKKRIDLRGYGLDEVEGFLSQIRDVVGRAVQECLELTLESDESHAYLPIQYAGGDNPSDGFFGAPVDDPLLIYVTIAIPNADDGPVFKFSLGQMVTDIVDPPEGGLYASEDAVIRLRDALREQADRLDAALAKEPR